MKIAIVCGGRTFKDIAVVRQAIADEAPNLIIEGGAKGADSLARLVAIEQGIQIIEIPANWEKWGRSAGPQRNNLMITVAQIIAREYDSEIVVIAMPGGTGTNHMVTAARNLCIRVNEPATAPSPA